MSFFFKKQDLNRPKLKTQLVQMHSVQQRQKHNSTGGNEKRGSHPTMSHDTNKDNTNSNGGFKTNDATMGNAAYYAASSSRSSDFSNASTVANNEGHETESGHETNSDSEEEEAVCVTGKTIVVDDTNKNDEEGHKDEDTAHEVVSHLLLQTIKI